MALIEFDLPADEAAWRPDVFPGSPEAVSRGCVCPNVQQWPGKLIFDSACPVHTQAEMAHWQTYLRTKKG